MPSAMSRTASERAENAIQGTAAADLRPLPPHEEPRGPVGEDPDAEIAARAAAGDMGAFDALVTLYTGRVFAVAFRMLGDRAEAEDLCQEVFVALHKALPDFRGESRLSTWIYRITKNRCLNRIKFLKRRHIGQLADVDDPAVAGAALDPDASGGGVRDPRRRLAEDELSELVQTHLMSLPEEQRTLVVLRDLEDLSYDEIVEATGLALGTVKSRLHRARAALAKALAPHLSDLPSSIATGSP
jgi:RNA polymerase sigma-70 factor (ECF subfamily)